jgi:membrane associated rhomboid family serine protease
MLSDRSYMRDSYGRQTTSVLTWIISALAAGFILQVIFERAFLSGAFTHFAALSSTGLRAGRVWSLLSYTFVHEGILHVLGNALALYFLGRELIPMIGEKRFGWLYVLSALAGGLLWFAVNFNHAGSLLIGASATVCAFLVLFACFFPNREITLLVFFVLPVTLKPKYLAAIVAIVDLFGFLFGELPGGRFDFGIAHSAHLGGMVVGLLYYHFIHQREWRNPDSRAEIELPRWLRKSQKAQTAAAPYKVNLTTREDLRAEVDRILDKINSEGFGALTAEEKRVLDEAKDSLSRR